MSTQPDALLEASNAVFNSGLRLFIAQGNFADTGAERAEVFAAEAQAAVQNNVGLDRIALSLQSSVYTQASNSLASTITGTYNKPYTVYANKAGIVKNARQVGALLVGSFSPDGFTPTFLNAEGHTVDWQVGDVLYNEQGAMATIVSINGLDIELDTALPTSQAFSNSFGLLLQCKTPAAGITLPGNTTLPVKLTPIWSGQ